MTDIDMPIYVYIPKAKEPKPAAYTSVAPGWNLRMLFSTEPALAMIAIEAAAAKRGAQKERIDALGVALRKADKLVGDSAGDPRLRSKDAWDLYNNYLYDLLQL